MYKNFCFYDISVFDINQKAYISAKYIIIRYINNTNGGKRKWEKEKGAVNLNRWEFFNFFI